MKHSYNENEKENKMIKVFQPEEDENPDGFMKFLTRLDLIIFRSQNSATHGT